MSIIKKYLPVVIVVCILVVVGTLIFGLNPLNALTSKQVNQNVSQVIPQAPQGMQAQVADQPQDQEQNAEATATPVTLANSVQEWTGGDQETFSNMLSPSDEEQLYSSLYNGTFVELKVRDIYNVQRPNCTADAANDATLYVEEINPEGAKISVIGLESNLWVKKQNTLAYGGMYCDKRVLQVWGEVMGVKKLAGQPAIVRLFIYANLDIPNDSLDIRPILK